MDTPTEFLKLLTDDLRWQLLSELAQSDRRVQELVDTAGKPQNLVSYHLRQLRDQHLVTEHRSSADARDVYYSLDLSRLRKLYLNAGRLLHPFLVAGMDNACSAPRSRPLRVLFLCTHNSARSQMAEAILRAQAGDRIEVYSAGSKPTDIHPLTTATLESLNLSLEGHRAKNVIEFAGQRFDVIVTVCDQMREVCPVFPETPRYLHWSIPDPAAVGGESSEQRSAFAATAAMLNERIQHLLSAIESPFPSYAV